MRLGPEYLRNHGLTPGQGRDFSHLQSLQTSSWTHPISYSTGTEGPFPTVAGV